MLPKMKDLRIVFMGTPDFAVAILKTMVENNLNVVGVITAPDKPAGRGRKLNQSAVKKYATSVELPVLQPTNLKSEIFINELEELQANVQVVVAFRMLPEVIWRMPKYGTFNLHASLLPDYRGAAPIHWAIVNGETETGVTTFFIDDKIDTGEVILKDTCNITSNETVGSLHDKLMHLGATTVMKTLELIASENVVTKKQPESNPKFAPKLTPENTRINWNDSLKNVYNHIRGLNPFPAAWTEIDNNNTLTSAKIYACEMVSEKHNHNNGKIITTKKELLIAIEGGFINVLQIKLSGKKLMDVKSLLNGYSFDESATAL